MTMANPPADASLYRRTERWISWLTLCFGVLVGALVSPRFGWHWGAGIVIGALLAWLNFRWLRQGLDALTSASAAQASQKTARVPLLTYLKAAIRYGLIALAVYVSFKYLNVPILSMVLGLCALGAATIAVSVREILHPTD